MPRIDPDIPKNRFVGAKQSLKITMLKNSMKIENWKLKITVFGFAILLLALWLPKTVEAGFIIQRPLYIGLTNGLVGSWTFDGPDMAVDTAFDRSGQGNNGTLTNGPTRTEGKIGQALNFDGSDDDVNVGSGSSLDDLGPMTITAWIYPKSQGEGNLGRIVSKDNNVNNAGFWSFNLNGTTLVFAKDFSTTILARKTSNNSYVLNTWQYVVVTWDGSEIATNVHIYVNGVETSYQTTTNGVDTKNSDASQNVYIGTTGSHTLTFNGLIDEVRVYNRALSTDEIKRLYKIGATTKINVPRKDTLKEGLMGYWTFDGPDMAVDTAFDKSGQNNKGTLTGGPTRQIGKVGQGLNFDANDDLVSVGTPASLNITGALTISAWIYPRTFGSSASSFRGRIVDKENDFISGYSLSLYDPNTAGVPNDTFALFINASGGNLNCFASSNSIVLNRWQQVAVTLDSSKNCIPYVDGAKATTTNGFIMGSLPTTGSNSFVIGNNSGNTREFDGSLDEVRVYNRALSTDEIKRLYKMGATTKINVPRKDTLTDGLMGYWTFDGPDMAVDTAFDKSGQNNKGTLTGGPVRTEGKIGQALNFDGVNDYVDLGSPASLNGTGSHTISLWANLNDIGAPGNYDVFFEKNSDCGVGAGWGMVVYYGTPSTWAAAVVTTSGGAVSYSALGTSPTPTTGTWVHLVGVYDNSAQTITLYTDGVSRQTTNTGSTLRVGDNSTIGVQKPNACTLVDLANAKIDEVRVYNRALSADEIKRLYNMGR